MLVLSAYKGESHPVTHFLSWVKYPVGHYTKQYPLEFMTTPKEPVEQILTHNLVLLSAYEFLQFSIQV